MPEWLLAAVWMAVMAAVVIAFVLLTVLILVWLERKLSADLQNRVGPNRVGGRFGPLQTAADALKLLLKEDLIPDCADRRVFILAPLLVFVPALAVFLVVPFSQNWIVQDLNLGVLFVIAVSALPVIGLVMAGGRASNSKYALFGAMRAAAQSMSYEIPLVLAMVCVVVAAGSLRVGDIVQAQLGGHWFILRPPLTLAFVIYFITAMAEVNRVPFDLPEAESEPGGRLLHRILGDALRALLPGRVRPPLLCLGLRATLFFGAWEGPWLPPAVWLLLKTYAIIVVIMWIRWTLPRLRIDQVMGFAWKLLVPASLVAVALTGLGRGGEVVVMSTRRYWLVDIGVGTWSLVKGLAVTGRNFFRPRITENYPAAQAPPSPRLRGKLVHLRDADGRLKCTACLACQKACPTLALPTIKGDDQKGRARRARTYVWDAGRCLFCGYCVEACPFDAIKLGQQHSVVGETREELRRSLEEMLEPAGVVSALGKEAT